MFSVVAKTEQPDGPDHEITPEIYDYLNVDLDTDLPEKRRES